MSVAASSGVSIQSILGKGSDGLYGRGDYLVHEMRQYFGFVCYCALSRRRGMH